MSVHYRVGMRFYDALSGERCVYRSGRERGVRLLGLRAGDTVVDLGCGTGLSFALLVDAVGPNGRVIGVDASDAMLKVARRRVAKKGWSTVSLVNADALHVTGDDLPAGRVDAVFSSYALSVMADPVGAMERAVSLVKRGGRMGIVDMQRPTGMARVFTPFALAATAAGGADIDAHPWEWLKLHATDLSEDTRRGGHIVAAAGTLS
ncbi:MAG: methyltransferase domain-containing protein [Salinibacterium sp.]|nr:methyltransferase domain-containing protein [Salinibacterium sp.]